MFRRVFIQWLAVILMTLAAIPRQAQTAGVRIFLPVDALPPEWREKPEALTIAEVIDLHDRVVSTAAPEYLKARSGLKIRFDRAPQQEKAAWGWHRLRLKRGPKDRGALILALGDYLPRPQLRMLGSNQYAAGSPIRIRTVVLDGRSGVPLDGSRVHYALKANQKLLAEAEATTDDHGSAEPELRAPSAFSGHANLEVSLIGAASPVLSVQQLRIERRNSILLTTDKPIYQPGQRVYIRALALDRISRHAISKEPVTIEVEDGRANKVFRRELMTNEYGVAATIFQLADEVNLGNFKARIILGDPETTGVEREEKTFLVDRYRLPKFKLSFRLIGETEPAVGADQPEEKRFYLPGQPVEGRFTANYLFGRPVSGAKVKFRLVSYDVETVEIKSASAALDSTGTVDFKLALPEVLAGMPLTGGAAPVVLEAEVTDGAGHKETRGRDLLVATHPILITAVPEGSELIPGVENRILVRTTDPAGRGVQTKVSGGLAGAGVLTDPDGFVVLNWHDGDPLSLKLLAQDLSGRKGETQVSFYRRAGETSSLLIRPERSVYKTGEPLIIQFFSGKRSGTVYLDLIKAGQIVQQRAIDLQEGRGFLRTDLSPDLAGTLEIRAYQFSSYGEPVGDRRLIYVEPGDGLTIKADIERDEYHPGETARVALQVSDRDGRPVQAILDVRAVDEAVYAMAKLNPGFAQVFFTLERELLTPRYEIHGPDAEAVFRDDSSPTRRDHSAEILFAAAQATSPYTMRASVVSPTALGEMPDSVRAGYQRRCERSVDRLLSGLTRYFRDGRNSSGDLNRDAELAVKAGVIRPRDLRDPWSRPYRFSGGLPIENGWDQIAIGIPGGAGSQFFIPIRIERRRWSGPSPEAGPFLGSLNLSRREHGPADAAEIRGRVIDPAGKPVVGAVIKAVNPVNREVAQTKTDEHGEFAIMGLPDGAQRLILNGAGYRGAEVTTSPLRARDSLRVEATLYPLPVGMNFRRAGEGPPAQIQRIVYDSRGTTWQTGAIKGRVTDEKGQPMPGAVVKTKSLQGVKGAEADANGNYSIPYLLPGTYEVTVSMDGYNTVLQTGVAVRASSSTVQAFKLASGGEVITVTGAKVRVDTGSSTSTTRVNLADAVETFARDREMTPAFDMAPGAVGGGNPSVLGASGLENQYLISGVNITNSGYGGVGANGEHSNDPSGIRTRSYFPETLYINPLLITDEDGRAELAIPLADSITTWRLSLFASTRDGRLGSAEAGIKVFQDFFIDLDLPVNLTRGDIVTVPVAIHNYRDRDQFVTVSLKNDGWYELVGDSPIKNVNVGAGQVSAAQFRVRATKAGLQRLSAKAVLSSPEAGKAAGDAVVREVEVVPEGRQVHRVVNGTLTKSVVHDLELPPSTLSDSTTLITRIYPAPMSQVVEGLDSMLRMPGGCFEQTSSSTYPNVLVLQYLKSTGKLAPELQAKAEGFINLGYQRLVSFEVKGGGFSWFGNAPAHQILTAYGLMEFSDMAKVYPVDEQVIARTQTWLVSKQQPDGGWLPDQGGIAEGAINAYRADRLRIAAYIAWSLRHSGYDGPALARADAFIRKGYTGKEDGFTLAVLANYLIEEDKEGEFTRRVVGDLADRAQHKNDQVYWSAGSTTSTYATGDMADLETTGFVLQVLLRSRSRGELAAGGLKYIASRKDALGNWHSTQATIQSLRALILGQELGGAGEAEGTLEVRINGQPAGTLTIDAKNRDLMQQVVFKPEISAGRQRVELQFKGKGALTYQVVARHHVPWTGDGAAHEPLSIKVEYDRTQLAKDDTVRSKVTIRNQQGTDAHQVMVDLGIPPGFDPETVDLDDLVGKGAGSLGHLTKYTRTGRQLILYFDGLASSQPVTFSYRLRAKFPVKAVAPASRIYEYYNPEVEAFSPPKNMVVTE